MATESLIASCDRLLRFIDTVPKYGGNIPEAILEPQVPQEDIPELPPQDKYYLTTAIHYTNGSPHMGHCYEEVTADIIARCHRIYGRDVYFLTGTDEHGQKIQMTAEKEGMEPIDICNKYQTKFANLFEQLNISNDKFIRTTYDYHKAAAQELWNRAMEKGDLVLRDYEGWYNVKEETFVSDTDAEKWNYKDPGSGVPFIKSKETCFFFTMSKYQQQLIDHIENNPSFIQPEYKRTDVLTKLNEGLRDLCVSRTTFNWGVPVPNQPEHVMYVWFDALTNYLSGVDFPQGDLYHFWPADVHIIGKDITWFHTVIWPCMLMSCDVPLPRCVFSHGFVNDENNEKMSKTRGNVVNPIEELKLYEVDTLRYFLAFQAPYGSDLGYSRGDLERVNDGMLVHVFGNFANRAINLAMKACKGVIPDVEPEDISQYVDYDLAFIVRKYDYLYRTFQLSETAAFALEVARLGNKYLDIKEPWKMKGAERKTEKQVVLRTALELCYITTHFMEPFTPNVCERIFQDLGTPRSALQHLHAISNLQTGTKLRFDKKTPYFPQFTTKVQKKAQGKDGSKDWAKQKQAKAREKELERRKQEEPVLRLEFKVGQVLSVADHPSAESCYVAQIDVGEASPRNVVSGIKNFVSQDEYVGMKVILFSNIKPSEVRDVVSEGLVLTAIDRPNNIRPVVAPPAAQVGERVLVEGMESELQEVVVDKSVNAKKNNSPWKKVSKALKVGPNGVATYKGLPLLTSAGPVTCPLVGKKIQ